MTPFPASPTETPESLFRASLSSSHQPQPEALAPATPASNPASSQRDSNCWLTIIAQLTGRRWMRVSDITRSRMYLSLNILSLSAPLVSSPSGEGEVFIFFSIRCWLHKITDSKYDLASKTSIDDFNVLKRLSTGTNPMMSEQFISIGLLWLLWLLYL